MYSRARRTCFEPGVKSCSVEMTVKCTGPKSNPYHGESAMAAPASPGMRNLASCVKNMYGVVLRSVRGGTSLNVERASQTPVEE